MPRNYAREYERRQERARALGFGSYYERRVPNAPELDLEERAARRGHRGTAAFLRSLKEGDLILCDVREVDRDQVTGLYRRIDKTVIPLRPGARERFYVLRRLTRERLVEVIRLEVAAGVIFSPTPSLDQRRILSADVQEGGY